MLPNKWHYMIIARARQMFGWWPEKREAKLRAQIAYNVHICEGCHSIVVQDPDVYDRYVSEVGAEDVVVLDKVEVDHIDPVIAVGDSWVSYDSYFERLFCPASNLQVLCTMCHKFKTLTENDERRYNKKKEKPDV